jgi:hypothetical protein
MGSGVGRGARGVMCFGCWCFCFVFVEDDGCVGGRRGYEKKERRLVRQKLKVLLTRARGLQYWY